MGRIVSKEEAIKMIENSKAEYILFTEYESAIGISPIPVTICKDKGKMIIRKSEAPISYVDNEIVKTLRLNPTLERMKILMLT